MTETTSTQAFKDQATNTHTDDIARIANALERIADNEELRFSRDEEMLEVLREFVQEFGLYSRNGFGL
jgi:regulator of sigma D